MATELNLIIGTSGKKLLSVRVSPNDTCVNLSLDNSEDRASADFEAAEIDMLIGFLTVAKAQLAKAKKESRGYPFQRTLKERLHAWENK